MSKDARIEGWATAGEKEPPITIFLPAAVTLHDAIIAHGDKAEKASVYRAFPARDRDHLLSFVGSR